MTQTICIIEDEADIVRLLTYNLEKEGYTVFSQATADNARLFIEKYSPALVLLDLMIPGGDGFDVCKQLKSNFSTADIPIIMLTAKTDEANIVTGLELGSADYVTKPFSIAVLIARIRAVLRGSLKQSPSQSKSELIQVGDLVLYPDRYEVYLGKRLLDLNVTEFNLLHCFSLQPGRVFSRLQLIDYMKGENYYVTVRLIDVLLVSLRKKLGVAAELIQTVRGVGYKLKVVS